MIFRVVLTDPDLHPPDEETSALLRQCEAVLESRPCASSEELLEFCAGADAVLCARTRITRGLLQSMPCCRIIARLGTGYDNIDIVAAGEAGIPVTNVPEFCTHEVADHTLALILACSRHLLRLDHEVRHGSWNPNSIMPAYRLRGKTLGLAGFGKIGRAVADRALAFGMRVSYFDPAFPNSHDPQIQTCSNLDELLQKADVVSLHVPLTNQTRGLIGLRELRLMKPAGILINCARGGVVVEEDLCQALQDRVIAAAGLDTMALEPPAQDHPLFHLSNVVLTPHCAAHTIEALADLRRQAYEEVSRALRGEPLLHVVNQRYLQAKGLELIR